MEQENTCTIEFRKLVGCIVADKLQIPHDRCSAAIMLYGSEYPNGNHKAYCTCACHKKGNNAY